MKYISYFCSGKFKVCFVNIFNCKTMLFKDCIDSYLIP